MADPGPPLDLKKVPKERWAHVLYMALLKYFEPAPMALFALVEDGEDKFVKQGKATDSMGLKEHHYRAVFKKLRRRAKRMGMDQRVH